MTVELREARRDAGLSVRDVADLLGVHPTTVHRWERHERRPAPAVVNDLARTLRTDRAALVGTLLPVTPDPGPQVHRGTGLRPLRKQRGVPVARIADAVGVPTHTVYNWESGRAGVPASAVPALADVLGLPIDTLLPALGRTAPVAVAPVSPLRRLWAAAGWSQASLARTIGVSRTTLRDWERGVTVPPWPALRRLAETIGAPLPRVAEAVGRRPPIDLDVSRWRPGMLARVLVALREWSDLTQAALARRVGCSVAAVRSWERGRHAPSAPARRRLERLYRLAPGALALAIGPAGSTMET